VAEIQELNTCLQAHQLKVPESCLEPLVDYCQRLWKRNEQVNLTRHTDFDHFVRRDLVDTLQLSQLLKEGERILDVGSGGGVPGIVLAILRPDLEIALCDSVGKKATILAELCRELRLDVEVHHARAEAVLDDDERFDSVTARAVGPLAKLFTWFKDCWPNMGRLLAIKGPGWRDERVEAEQQRLMKHLLLKIASRYPVPGETWESYILEIRRVS
jgi:16S rRNA (guanine527-N7)-methyltransferase